MSSTFIAIIGLIVLFLFIFLRMPVSFCMFIVGFVGVWVMSSSTAAFNVLSSDVWSQLSSYTLSVIPLYVFMGEIVFRSGITTNLFDAAYKWIGHLKGGMASTTILASAGFSSICGSNSATAATMGTVALPELKKYKYDPALSTGSVATGGTLGIIIAPSTALIVIALQTEQSIRDLFIASIIPSIFLVVLIILTILFLCMKNPEYGPAGERSNWKMRFVSLLNVVPVLLLFVFVIGGLYIGWFTPTESGAFGAFGAILLTLLMRKLTWGRFKIAIASALKTSAMVMMLMMGAIVFGKFLSLTRLPFTVADYVNDLAVPSVLALICILIIYAIGGSIMDALGFLIISLPIFFPTVIALGYDPIWFAIVVCIITSMGAITPPVGVNVYVVKGLASAKDTSILTIFKGAGYFLVTYVILITFLILFPGAVLLLL